MFSKVYLFISAFSALIALVGVKAMVRNTWRSALDQNKIAAMGGVLSFVLCTFALAVGVSGAIKDTEIINGFVESKSNKRVSCEHSQEICTGSGKNKTCVTIYDHSFDVDWFADTTVGRVYIRREDSQGIRQPRRWTKIKIGEPAAREQTYENYLLANKDSLFNDSSSFEQYRGLIPKYPFIYDYYRINRVLAIGDGVSQYISGWNARLNEVLKELGREKQVNIIVIATSQDKAFSDATKADWLGGKKNDVILWFGIQDGQVRWFDSTSFMDGYGNGAMHAALRGNAIGENVDIGLLDSSIEIIREKFNRHEMANEQAQLEAYSLPPALGIFAFIFGLLPLLAFYWIEVRN